MGASGSPLRIVAFDLSLTAPAVCCDGLTDVANTKGLDGHERLQFILEWVTDWTTMSGPILVGIEGYAHGAKWNTHKLGELGGLVRHSLWRRHIPYVDVKPTKIKKYATGKGNASKDLVQDAAYRRGRDLYLGTGNDEADAFWLWALLTELAGTPAVDLPAKHREALDGLQMPDELDAA